MARIGRPARRVDCRSIIAVAFEPSLISVVAAFAERLQTTKSKGVPIAAMRNNVISDCCERCHATIFAKLTKRLLRKLQATLTTPNVELIPLAPRTLSRVWFHVKGQSEQMEPLYYLATPYSKYPKGIERAFIDAATLTGRLLKAGLKVYSPITHTHPIAIYAEIDPLDHDIWLPFDQAMMDKADALLVATMDGWEESKGIGHEIAWFNKHSKPIYALDPITLNMSLKDRATR